MNLMKKNLLLLLLFPALVFSQISENPKINTFIDSLGSGTNYFFVEETRPGTIKVMKKEDMQYDCIETPYYWSTDLFWEDKNRNYWRKSFFSCSEHTAEKVDATYLNFVKNNFETIKNEEVLVYKTKNDSISGDRTYTFFKTSNHEPIKNYIFRIDSEKISKRLETFRLTTQGDNLNYEHNQNLKIAELDRMIGINE